MASSPPVDIDGLDIFFNPPELSDTSWPFLKEGISSNYRISSSLSSPPVFSETSTRLHASDHSKNGGDLDSSMTFGEEYQAMAGPGFDEAVVLESLLHHQKDKKFPNPIIVSDNFWPDLGEASAPIMNGDEFDPNMLLDDQELIVETLNSNAIIDQENASLNKSSADKGFEGKREKKKEIRHRFKRLLTDNKMVKCNAEEGSASKKEQHNAKEKIRRMKLNASYLALGSLLPNSRRSKKRWTAPVIIDKVLQYIPELESEIEKLTLRKKSILSKIESKRPIEENACVQLQSPTVSIHEIRPGELIIQICMQLNQNSNFSNLLMNLESDGIKISSASSVHVCDDKICYHTHIKMDTNPLEDEYVAAMRNKVKVQVWYRSKN